MQWYEADVRALEVARFQRELILEPVVFYGSSTLRLWTNLAQDLGEARAVNLGFGGSTLEACSFFFERLVVPEQPCSLVLYAGDNDLGDGLSPEQVLASYRALMDKVQLYFGSIPSGFISVKPSPARLPIIANIRRANELVQEEIQKRQNTYYINVFDAMLNQDGTPCPELFDAEGLHMNHAGYELWTEILRSHRNQIFTHLSYLVGAGGVSLTGE